MMNAAERRRAFDLPASLIELAGTVQNPAQRIGLLVSAAYFGVAKRFFVPRHYRERDVAHAARRLRLPPDVFEASQHPARARQRHELAILEAHGMRRFDRASETELTVDIDAMAATHLRPKLIFLRCLDLLGQRRVQLPSEHRLTALVASAMARRKRQLIERVEQVLTPELGGVLDGLLASGGEPQDPGEGRSGGKRARLTLLRRLTQSTGPKDVRSRVAHLLEVRAIHDRLRDVLPAIGLGREGIAYFAGGVLRARLSQLHQRSDPDRHLQRHRLRRAPACEASRQPRRYASDERAGAPRRLPTRAQGVVLCRAPRARRTPGRTGGSGRPDRFRGSRNSSACWSGQRSSSTSGTWATPTSSLACGCCFPPSTIPAARPPPA